MEGSSEKREIKTAKRLFSDITFRTARNAPLIQKVQFPTTAGIWQIYNLMKLLIPLEIKLKRAFWESIKRTFGYCAVAIPSVHAGAEEEVDMCVFKMHDSNSFRVSH